MFESCRPGPSPLTPEPIRIVPAKTAAASKSTSSRGTSPRFSTRLTMPSNVTCCTTNRR